MCRDIEMGKHKYHMRLPQSGHCNSCTNYSIGMGNNHMGNNPKRSCSKLSKQKTY
jgi:hypothetical protein